MSTRHNLCVGIAVLVIVIASPAMAKGGIGEIFAALIGEAVGKAVGKAASKGMGVEQALVKACDQINKQLPMMVDKQTRWDNMTPGPGQRITYNYTFINGTIRNLDVNGFSRAMTQQLRRDVCSSTDSQVFLKNGVSMSYSYRDKDSVHIVKIDITPRHCGYIS